MADLTVDGDTVSVSGGWEFPPPRAGAPGWKAYRRASITRIQGLGTDPNEVDRGRAEHEGDKFAKSAKDGEVQVVMVASEGSRTPCGAVPSHGGEVAVVRIVAEESRIQIRCSLHEC